jgi:hypothetical membrane protein
MKKNCLNTISALCGFILPIIALISIYISLQQVPDFNWTENAISDLGRPGEAFCFFNVSLIIIGLLFFIFSLGLIKIFKENKIAPVMIFISSFFFIGIGIFPLPNPVHIVVSSLFFIAFPLGFLILGLNLIKKSNSFIRKMGFFAIINSIIALCSTVLLFFISGIAITELLVVIPGFFWCMVFGLKNLLDSSVF